MSLKSVAIGWRSASKRIAASSIAISRMSTCSSRGRIAFALTEIAFPERLDRLGDQFFDQGGHVEKQLL
jgi:hypothetical protein